MLINLKDTLRHWLDGDTPLDRDRVEALRAAGLIAPVGYLITEAGRTLMVQNPPTPAGTLVEVSPETLAGPPPLEKSAKDTQVGGDHYKRLGRHQPWEVLATWMTPAELRGYMKGTVIAYLAREQDKGGDTDVAKALHTMQLWQDVRKDK